MKSHKYLAAAGLIVTLSLIATLAVADEAVERILCNARIFTAEPDHPYAEAVAIRNDKIVAVVWMLRRRSAKQSSRTAIFIPDNSHLRLPP